MKRKANAQVLVTLLVGASLISFAVGDFPWYRSVALVFGVALVAVAVSAYPPRRAG